ncbi:hypothetical protein RND81_10G148000 [Saponaria officinalis]|uniref:Peptidase A1 domain-containing protein n=1 Tax=Saponaria officinalis TaxID=3572 RepID=A0AAW1I1U2_SAPOF
MVIKFYKFVISSSLITILVIVNSSLAHQQGFTTDLIHRDSPLSPLYNSFLSHHERLRNSIQHIQSQVKYAHGEYFMELSVGTPPVSQLGIIGTGSDLIWTQCHPCSQCYKFLPIFDPRKSSAYTVQSCDTRACLALGATQHTCTKDNTYYSYQYDNLLYTAEYFATETITFFKSQDGTLGKSFPNISFGCGNNNDGKFTTDGSGIIGLGGEPLSLVSQLGSSIDGKFSYCLIPLSTKGNYTMSGPGVISTPIIKGDPNTFYYNEGDMIIDAAATMTILPSDMYNDLSSTLGKAIRAKKVNDPTGQLKVCYRTSNNGHDLGVPNVTLHFEGGDLVLMASNTFVEVSSGVMCLAVLARQGQLGASLGNIAQMDFLIGHDIVEGRVSFRPTDCTTVQN